MPPKNPEKNYLADKFEADRSRLRGVAYRMLGSLPEAEDAVQEAWLRLSRADTSGVDNLSAWLTTVTSRVCLDMLRSKKSRREDALLEGGPEPSVSGEEAIERETILADSVGLALLVVLQALSPAERIAFVLHDLFDMPFDEIAPIVERTPDAARQLASRARRRVRGGEAPLDAAQTAKKSVVDAFLTASRTGDMQGLLAVLDPNVVVRADVFAGGGQTRELRGREKVAAYYDGLAQTARTALVDGEIGAVVAPRGKLYLVLDIKVENGKVVEITAVGDPERLATLELGVTDL
ncbi:MULTISPECIES: sigma-70 family RNA polymerase sigma factor [unclassified Caulobacter]|jgi:RNA polymerase sigma-70 factor (ECF subfamily)|uniref:sigma-70 family RNA polymerase sigma factor n=1 Tax=unclassified Caulobacter TaxID=2648921 RepID=UPI0006F4D7F1|nr:MULTISPECIES: sigma-70 family RNA polymerase sigma factor [unclassified Caulobacter]KQV54826.1 RNA polymerase subunit sigma-70 [Caulobacter sp. Root342]KQV68567.1 RNA polymerase subunit sigma-70 [Caulobacter sp. Root343]